MFVAFFTPPSELASIFMHGGVIRLDGGESRLPVQATPALILHITGGNTVIDGHGPYTRQPRFALLGPTFGPSHTRAEPNTLFIFQPFRPGVLHPTLGVSPATIEGCAVPLNEILDPQKIDQFLARLTPGQTVEEYIASFQDFLVSVIPRRGTPGISAPFEQAVQALLLPVAELALSLGIGARQLERRVRQMHGTSLRDLRRLVRFGAALPGIFQGDTVHGDLTRIAHAAGYFDQAHMHREFMEWTGMSPVQLVQNIRGDEPAYWAYRLSADDYRKLCLP
jgi:AraC-like DNA-binding protein